MDAMMNSFSSMPTLMKKHGVAFSFSDRTPDINIKKTPQAYQIDVKVPDGQEVSVNTELNDKTLKIFGNVKSHSQSQQNGRNASMLSEAHFSQSFYLPDVAANAKMTTEQKNGEVHITVPRFIS